MALDATYDTVLSRIRLAVTGASGTATYMVVDRTTDGVRYTTVRGGAAAAVSGGIGSVDDYEFPAGVAITYRARAYTAADVLTNTYTDTITQDLDAVWLKVPSAPFLNRPVTVSSAGDRTRAARRGIFDIAGRSNPVVVSDIRSSMSFDLRIRTEDADEEETLDLILGTGEILFFHLPVANKCMPGGYYSAGDVTWGPPSSRAKPTRIFNIPLTGAAAPGPDVVGTTYTWASAVAEYATWTDLIADNATWADLLQRVGSPGDVVVP